MGKKVAEACPPLVSWAWWLLALCGGHFALTDETSRKMDERVVWAA